MSGNSSLKLALRKLQLKGVQIARGLTPTSTFDLTENEYKTLTKLLDLGEDNYVRKISSLNQRINGIENVNLPWENFVTGMTTEVGNRASRLVAEAQAEENENAAPASGVAAPAPAPAPAPAAAAPASALAPAAAAPAQPQLTPVLTLNNARRNSAGVPRGLSAPAQPLAAPGGLTDLAAAREASLVRTQPLAQPSPASAAAPAQPPPASAASAVPAAAPAVPAAAPAVPAAAPAVPAASTASAASAALAQPPPAPRGLTELAAAREASLARTQAAAQPPPAVPAASAASAALAQLPPASPAPAAAPAPAAPAAAAPRGRPITNRIRSAASSVSSRISSAASATASRVSRAASATGSAATTVAQATARGVGRAARAASPVGEAIGKDAKSAIDATLSAASAAGTAIVSAMDLGKDGMPIDIMGDRYFLDTRFKGAADINTRTAFDNLYGVSTGDALTITTIYKVFQSPAPMSDKGIIDKINTLSEGELKSLAVAINTRIDTLKRTINSLSRGSVLQSVAKYKLDRMKKLYGWISTTLAARASGVKATAPITSINYRTHYKALKEDKKDDARKHEYMFDAIMGIAYYLANPDFLLSNTTIDDTARQAIIDKFESVLDLIDKGHLHDLVKSIRADAELPVELKDADAMNYFDRIRLKEVLKEKTDIGASGEILRQVKMPTMDEVMSNRVVAMIKLFQAKKYIDASAVAQIEASIRDKDTYTLMGSLGNAIKDVSGGLGAGLNATSKETIRGLYDAFTPVYNYYRRVFDPVFTFLEENVIGDDFDKWPLGDMERVFQLGISKYTPKDISNNLGVYKLIDVSSGFIDFVTKLQNTTRFSGPLMTAKPEIRKAFSSIPNITLGDIIGERPDPRKFAAKTPIIKYLLRSQFNVPQTLDDDDLEQKLVAYGSPQATPVAASKLTKSGKKAKKGNRPRVTTGGGPEQFSELKSFLETGRMYMFVNHRTDPHKKDLNPHIYDVSNNKVVGISTQLAHYKTLKLGDVIDEPYPLSYVQLDIVVLAICCMIIFYKRLEKVAR